ncbi:MAG: ABC transporter permease [Clostridia bacterium]|nr:ABC transporter permease [Clostridia bacterium]
MTTKPNVFQKIGAFVVKKSKSFKKNANIVRELVIKNVKIQYRNSVIGVLWTVLNPLLNMLVMYFVFSTIMDFGSKQEEDWFSLYILCGNIMFSFVRNATTQSLPSIVQNRGLLTKNKISEYVFPISKNLSAVVNFSFSMIALIGVMAVVSFFAPGSAFSYTLIFVFLMLPALFLFSFGLSLVLSSLYVFFRDIQHFYTVFLTLWTYLTPIFWDFGLFKNKEDMKFAILETVVNLNPMFHFVEYFRDIIYRCSVGFTPVLETFSTLALLYVIGLISLGIGILIFALTRRKFIYNI